MEDLRPKKNDLTPSQRKYYFPSLVDRIKIFLNKNKKVLLKYVIFIIISIYILTSPIQIGSFIGDWSYKFYTSITKNFTK